MYRKTKQLGAVSKDAPLPRAGAACGAACGAAEDPFQAVLDVFMGEFEALHPTNLYPCAARIFALHDKDAGIGEVITILCYLARRQDLDAWARAMRVPTLRAWNKQDVASALVIALERIHGFAGNPRAMSAIIKSQRRRRLRTAARRGRLPSATHLAPGMGALHPINTEDPFTLDALDELPPEHVFTYTDAHGATYGFCAPELHYAVRTLGPFNPYTREDIPIPDLFRLEQLMRTLPKKVMPSREASWRTAGDAFTTVADVYDHKGFILQVDWLCALTQSQVLHVFYQFHMLVRAPVAMMDLHVLDEPIRMRNLLLSHYALAKEMLQIAETDHPMQFYFLCNLMLALSEVSRPLRRSLPEWVYMGALTTLT